MTPTDLLSDGFERIREGVGAALDGLSRDQLLNRPMPTSNSIGWLVWHLTRVQDDHVADVAGSEQVYTSAGFAERFDLPYDTGAIGYGMKPDEVGAFTADVALLGEYLEATHARTREYLATVSEEDLDRIVDERWNPPVTLGARLVSVLNDDTQHLGQAAYVRGLLGL